MRAELVRDVHAHARLIYVYMCWLRDRLVGGEGGVGGA
jgi:hypothetical protein